MPILEGDIELIERYILGDLNNGDQILFNQRIKDVDFEMEFSLHSGVKNSATDIGRDLIRKQFSQWDQEAISKNLTYRSNRWLKIAAGFLILIGIAVFIVFRPTNLSPEELYLVSHSKFPNLLDPIEKGASRKGVSISKLYESMEYEEAIDIPAPDSLQQFYQGLSLLEMGNKVKAIDYLLPVANDSIHRFHLAGQWYLALAYLRDNQLDRCQILLVKISTNSSHDFQQNAIKLLADLKKKH